MSKGAVFITAALIMALVFSGCITPDEPAVVGDHTAPKISLLSPENNSFIRPGDVISLSVVDENLSSVIYSIDGLPFEELYYPFEISTSNWSEGNHSLRVMAEDAGGNNRSALYLFHIDLTPPEISLLFPANNSAIESNSEIRLSIEDVNFRSANYTLDGGGPRILTYPFIIPVKWWSEGPHTIKVNANDMAWNRGSATYSFIIDNRPTEIALVSPSSRVIRPGVPIVFDIEEENLRNLTCTVNGKSVDFSEHRIDTSGWPDGPYFIQINASDLAGHIKSQSYLFEVDSTPPQISSDIASGSKLIMNGTLDFMNNTFTHEGGKITVDIEDEHPGYEKYSLNGGPYTTLRGGALNLYGIRGRQANISILAEDLAGNRAYLNMSILPEYNLTIIMGMNESEVALPFLFNDTYIRTVLSSINSSYSKALTFVNGTWRSFNPAYPDKYNLDFLHVETYMGLQLQVNKSRAVLRISGPLPEKYTLHLRKGSNFVPYLSMRAMRLDRAFAYVPWYRVQRWDWQKGDYVDMRGNETLLPGHAYWVYTSAECIITYDF